MNIIEGKIAANADKLKETDVRITSRCDCLENELTKTVKLNDVEDLQEQFNNTEELINTNANSVKDIKSRIEQLRYKICAFQFQTSQELLAKEIYDKRFNILVYGLEEDFTKAWETKWESEQKFRKFLHKTLKISETYKIAVADVHRLPQHPVSREGQRTMRPIIAKLTSYADKKLVMRSLKNLKEYNERRMVKNQCGKSNTQPTVCI